MLITISFPRAPRKFTTRNGRTLTFGFLFEKVNFAPFFVAEPGNATVEAVADHVEHIAKVAGKDQ